jgi:hypothetical protein
VDGAPEGSGFVVACAQTGAAIARAAAKAVVLKDGFMESTSRQGPTRAKRPKWSVGEVLIPLKRVVLCSSRGRLTYRREMAKPSPVEPVLANANF